MTDTAAEDIKANPMDQNQFATGHLHDRDAPDEKLIKIWDLEKKTRTIEFGCHSQGINSINYSNDGKMILSSSNDRTIRLWDIAAGKQICKMDSGNKNYLFYAQLSGNDTYIASVGDLGLVSFWDIRNTSGPVFKNQESDVDTYILCCDFLQNDKEILTTSEKGEISIFDIEK